MNSFPQMSQNLNGNNIMWLQISKEILVTKICETIIAIVLYFNIVVFSGSNVTIAKWYNIMWLQIYKGIIVTKISDTIIA